MAPQKRGSSSLDPNAIFDKQNEVAFDHPRLQDQMGFVTGRIDTRLPPKSGNDFQAVRICSIDARQRSTLEVYFGHRTQELDEALEMNAIIQVSLQGAKVLATDHTFKVLFKDLWSIKIIQSRDQGNNGRIVCSPTFDANKRARHHGDSHANHSYANSTNKFPNSSPLSDEELQASSTPSQLGSWWAASGSPFTPRELVEQNEPHRASAEPFLEPSSYVEKDGFVYTRIEPDEKGNKRHKHYLGGVRQASPTAQPRVKREVVAVTVPKLQVGSSAVGASSVGPVGSKAALVVVDEYGIARVNGMTKEEVGRAFTRPGASKVQRKKLKEYARMFPVIHQAVVSDPPEAKEEPKEEPNTPVGFFLPKPYHTIGRILNGADIGVKVSVVGIVIRVDPPQTTKNGKWKRGLEIKDQTLEGLGQTISVSLFSSSAQGSEMPVVEYGQAIVLKSLKVSTWEKKTALTGYDDSWSWAGYDFRRATQLQNGLPLATELGREELEYIASLGKWWEKRTASGSEGVPGPARKPKVEMLMEQLDETNVFFITHLEILKVDCKDGWSEIYATDYTRPSDDYFKKLHFPDEPEIQNMTRYVVLIKAYQQDHLMASNLNAGEIWRFRNVRLVDGGFLKTGSGDKPHDRAIDQDYDDDLIETFQKRKAEMAKLFEQEAAEEESRERKRRELHAQEAAKSEQKPIVVYEGIRCMESNLPLSTVEHVSRCTAGCNTNNPEVSAHRIRARMVGLLPSSISGIVRCYCREHDQLLAKGTQLCPDCAEMEASSVYDVYDIRFQAVDEHSRDAITVAVSPEEAKRMIGADPSDIYDSDGGVEKLKKCLKPWLGNLLKDAGMASEESYQKDQYLDLMVETWRAPKGDGLFHSLIHCEILQK